MAVLIPKTSCLLHDANAFYKVVFGNYAARSSTQITISTADVIVPFTASEAGNFIHVHISLYISSYNATRNLRCRLQENVSGTWTTRLDETKTLADLFGDNGGNWYGVWGGGFRFASSYAIDTAANKWRVVLSSPTGSGTIQLLTSDGTNPIIAMAVATDASFANGDVIVFDDQVLFESAAQFGSVASTGLTGTANMVSGLLSSNKRVGWVNSPAAAFSVRFPGKIEVRTMCDFGAGTPLARIPANKQGTLIMDSAAVPLNAAGGFYLYLASSSRYHTGSRIAFYGERPQYIRTKLTTDANSGQAQLQVANAVNWVAGQKVQISHADRAAGTETTLYTIQSVVGNTITLTGNLTYKRLAGATVMLMSGYGFKICTETEIGTGSTNYTNHTIYNPAVLVLDGVEVLNQTTLDGTALSSTYMAGRYGTQYGFNGPAERRIEYCAIICTQSGSYTLGYDVVPRAGKQFNFNNIFRAAVIYSPSVFNNHYFKSGAITFEDNVDINHIAYGPFMTSALITVYARRNIFTNQGSASYPFFGVIGVNSIYEDNECYGSAGWLTTFYNAINYKGKNNIYNRATLNAILLNNTIIDSVEEAPLISNITGSIVSYTAAALINMTIKNANTDITSDDTTIIDTINGSKLKAVNSGNISNNDRVFLTNGRTYRTGYGLADTLVWNGAAFAAAVASQFGLKLEPGTGLFSYKQEKTTGIITGKTMTIAARIKIYSANYWAGAYTMPTLRVVYDNGQEATAVAQQTTDGQQLVVNITPATATGKISIYLEGETDAVGEDAQFLLGELVAGLPEGVAIDTTRFSLWDDAFPLDTISTIETPDNFLNKPLANYNVPGSVGAKLNEPAPSIVLPGGIIS